MNGILGCLKLDHSLLEMEKLDAMLKALAYWEVDGSSRWLDGPMGMGCQFCFCAPEEREGFLPYYDKERGVVLTAGVFLDNREELLDELGLPPDERRSLPDTLLVHRAYLRWGEECVHHLTGDWHFALWDIRKQKLFLARDHHGNTGLCYTRGPGFFAFASGKKALLALPEVSKRPNLLRLAQVLTSWPGDGIITAYEGIFRLPPAHCLTVSDGEVKINRYWYAEDAPPIQLPREEDYLEAFLDQYDRAVRVRLRSNSPVGTTLSGGLDSGSVSVLAAKHLGTKGERLTAFTSVPRVDTTRYTVEQRFGDESEFAMATAVHSGNIDITWIRGDGISPVAGIERMLEVHDEPGHAAGNQFWIMDLLNTARARSFRVVLTGQGGNATVSWAGGAVNLLPCLVPWKWDELKSRFLDLRERQALGFVRGVRRFLLAPLVVPVLNSMQNGSRSAEPAFLSYSAIHPKFAELMELSRRMKQGGHDPHFKTGYNPAVARQRIIQPGRWVGGALWGESSGAHGLEVRDPTVDKRLMEFCLGIPDQLHFAEGRDRAVLRRTFVDLLPEKVRSNRRRGLQAADIGWRVLQCHSEIEEILQCMDRHELCTSMLDLPKMRAVLDSLQQGVVPGNSMDCRMILLRGLGVGIFLMRF